MNLPNRIWYVFDNNNKVVNTASTRSQARKYKRAQVSAGNTGFTIGYSTVTVSAPVLDSHS